MAAGRGRGRLLVVGTPIGNLGDLTPRAAEALRTADLVVAEDTRFAARLLRHLGVRTPTSSLNEHNAAERLPGLLARLAVGETLALTTDAGMPGVSDPGAGLVKAARDAGAAVEVVPGPSAVTAAVAMSGIASPGFVFGGFLPARPASSRTAALQRLLAGSGATGLPLVLFEAPHRVRSLLAQLSSVAPSVSVALCRELTKLHEEVLTGTPQEVAAALTEPRGEFAVVIGGIVAGDAAGAPVNTRALLAAAGSAGLTTRTTVEILRAAGLSRRDAYAAVQDAAQ